MAELVERITANFVQCGGRLCIRGMRIRVVDVLTCLPLDSLSNKSSKSCRISKRRTSRLAFALPAAGSITQSLRREDLGRRARNLLSRFLTSHPPDLYASLRMPAVVLVLVLRDSEE